MKKTRLFVAFLLIGYVTIAQVGIGNTNPNATLDISATNIAAPTNTDGILIPRIDDFPTTNPTTAQDGMMVFITGNGTPTKGFYYWDEDAGPAAWVAVSGGSGGGTLDEAYDFGGAGNGRIITADNGAVHIQGDDGLVIDGTVNAFNLSNGVSGSFSSLAAPRTLGVNSNGTIASHDAMTLYNNTTSSTLARGIYSNFVGNFTGDVDGIENRFLYNGAANVSGFKNSFNAYGNSNLSGLENNFEPVTGSLTTGNIIGVTNNFGNLVNTSGNTIGILNQILSGGNGVKYGTFNGIVSTGTGNLYGSYNTINAAGTGIGYGIYSEVAGSNNFAGYFIGRTEFGTDASVGRYLMPAADGTNGQVMTTDGAGNVTFQDVPGGDDADWYEADTTAAPSSNTAEIFTMGMWVLVFQIQITHYILVL